MNCDEFRRRIESGAVDRDAADGHARECPACASLLLAEILLARHGRIEFEPPPGLEEAVLARVREPEASGRAAALEIWRFAAAAAAVAAVTATAWLGFESRLEPLLGEVTSHVRENVSAVRELPTALGERVRVLLEDR